MCVMSEKAQSGVSANLGSDSEERLLRGSDKQARTQDSGS